MQKSSDEYQRWFKKNQKLIRRLGLSWQEAGFLRSEIDDFARDFKQFILRSGVFLLIALGLLLVLSILHVRFISDTVRLLYLIAYYCGLLGTFQAFYGFLFHFRGITPQRDRSAPTSLPSMVTIPSRVEELAHYVLRVVKSLAEYMNSEREEGWRHFRLEVRRQVAILSGFALLFVSFTIQLSLQFVRM